MTRRSRNQGRRRAERPGTAQVQQQPFSCLQNPFTPMALLSEDELTSIHHASLRVLEEVGINFLLDEARDILKAAGADVDPDSTRVRFDPLFIEQSLQSAPASFEMHARNPDHNLIFGDRHIVFSSVSSPPNASGRGRARRTGCNDDYVAFLKLAQSVNVCHMTMGHAVEPIDIPPATRHLDTTMSKIEYTDKIFSLYSLGRQRVIDNLDMMAILHGVQRDALDRKPVILTNVNCNSPLQFDVPMLWGIIEMARHRQPVVVTPFTLAGAMAPVTLAGALTQQNAEALAGLAFAQIVAPGTPVVYGGFTSNVDMKTGSPAFGTPEYAKAVIASGQFARRYNLPYRSSNVNASNAPDVQATYESMMSLWSVVMGGTNVVFHALGWLEGGLCANFEKFIIDAECIQGMLEFMRPIVVDDEEMAIAAIKDVGPGGHFFGTPHTLARYENAFYRPMISDWRNYETWQEDGAADTNQRAARVCENLLDSYQKPPLDPGVLEQLRAFVAIRHEQGGAPIT